MTSNTETVTRWHQEPWAWLVVGLPLAAVIACLLTIVIAIKTADGLVVDDYYKQGLEINRVLDREAEAARRGLSLSLTRRETGVTGFWLASHADAATLPSRLPVQFLHATREAGDRAYEAQHLGDGHYVMQHETLAEGPWYLDVSTPEWRLVQRFVVTDPR